MVRQKTRVTAVLLILLLTMMPFFSRTALADRYYGTVGESFKQVIHSSESIQECKQTSGALPPGLKCETDGQYVYIKGKPTNAGTYEAGIYIAEIEGGRESSMTISVTITIKSAPEQPTATPNAKVVITKSPTGEVVTEGGSCKFKAKADNAKKSVWHFVSPDGKTDVNYGKITKTFKNLKVSGGSGDTLTLSNIPYDLDGWTVYCRYSNGDDNVAKTEKAGITVIKTTPKPTATPTAAPTKEPTPAPTAEPTPEPTPEPTEAPVQQTPEPTEKPTEEPAAQNGNGEPAQKTGSIARTLIIAIASVLIVLILCGTAIILKGRGRGR